MKLAARRRLYEDIVDEIGKRIVSGVYSVGETLPSEEELCAEFDVSRTVIRDSIKVLTEKGIVRPKPRIGTIVQPREKWNQLDLDFLLWEYHRGNRFQVLQYATELRLFVEPDASAVMARRGSDEEIAAVRAAFAEMERAVAEDDVQAFIDADKRFHTHIIEACANPLLTQINLTLQQFLSLSLEVTANLPDKAAESLPTHRAIVEALVRRDEEAAYAAMKIALDLTMEVLLAELGPDGGDSQSDGG